ncbi:unnamed protein product (macronuclear) [Paramecium tetraurelia]|uniref:MD-2-related lipid-recognition domain-containing protein n=1 Tax=Paramecium tetraurelia TaxID=5888 RepID=A0DQ70_PARTE|nr:uncharacterized protein GSPATT00002587001 [Paramecium tetraurelia]CAK85187.1 unnamed protein product [Paramecium tetraurelia]|eukprot:XP_001452584.1 hypothetical protein (macronuclear) [Paramecium tetraurelia strain d4-2]
MKLLLAILLVSSVLAAIPTKVTNCIANPSIVFTEATFSVQPQKGVDETITLYGTANAHAELTNVQLKAKWNEVEVMTEDFPEDEIYDKDDKVVYTQTKNFPTFTPSGKITTQFYFQNAKGTNFACAEISFVL